MKNKWWTRRKNKNNQIEINEFIDNFDDENSCYDSDIHSDDSSYTQKRKKGKFVDV